MNDQPESTCPDCGKTYQPDLASDLGGGCPHCLARMLAEETLADDREGNPSLPLKAGDTLGGVEILAPLARGGMGVVYKGLQSNLNRVVAIKVIDAKLAGVPEFTQRFEREARALAVLNHPNVVQVFEHGHEHGLCYLVMEWVDGASLREILTAGHLSADDALRYVPQICDALEYAHAQGVVHRDIKPENILIDRQGQLKIADFGIARMRGEDQRGEEFVTLAGQSMGTPQYMAPEQQQHTGRVDHRADIYSLGVVFYEMLTGELPLGRFPNPSQRVKVDVTLDEVVLKTLEHDPNQRYQRASEIKQALTVPAAAATVAVPASPAPDANRPRITGFAWLGLACAAISLLVLWEMTRAWIAPATRLGPWFPRDLTTYMANFDMINDGYLPRLRGLAFFVDKPYLMLLRPLSIAAFFLAMIFGWLALWRVRKARGQITGSWLAIIGMLVPLVPLAALSVWYVIPAILGEKFWTVFREAPFLFSFSIAAFFLAMIFGYLALWRERKARGQVTGSRLAIIGMLAPLVLLAVLFIWPVMPADRRGGSNIVIILGVAAWLFFLLRGLFRLLRRYATDAEMATPVKSMAATFLITGIVGTTVFAVSEERREARWLYAKLESVLRMADMNPTLPALGSDREMSADQTTQYNKTVEMWLYIKRTLIPLESNFFAQRQLNYTSLWAMFEYEQPAINGGRSYCWMPPQSNYIEVWGYDKGSFGGTFGDKHRYLWIEDFSLQGGILTIDYRFPGSKERSWSRYMRSYLSEALLQRRREQLTKRDERIRSEYGVEPDTMYRVKFPIKQIPNLDKAFWQSAERVR